MRTATWTLVLVLIVAMAAAAALWLMRISLADVYLQRWCNDRDLRCEVAIDRLGWTGAHVSNVSVSSATGVPLSVDSATVDWAWTNGLTPSVTSVVINKPTLRAVFDGETLSWRGLETAFQEPSGQGQALPVVTLSGGLIELETPAGRVSGMVDAAIDPARGGRIDAVVPPVTLEEGQNSLVLDGAAFAVTIGAAGGDGPDARASNVSAEGTFDLRRARLGPVIVDGVSASLSLDERNGDGVRQLRWSGLAARAEASWGAVEALTLDGSAEVNPLALASPLALDSMVSSAEFALKADGVTWQGASATDIDMDAVWSRAGRGSRGATGNGATASRAGPLSGPFSFRASEIETAIGRISRASFDGEGTIVGLRSQTLDGVLAVAGVALTDESVARILDGLPAWPGFAAHEGAFRSGLAGLLSGFDVTLDGQLTRAPGGTGISLRGPTQLVGQSGAAVEMAPFSSSPWLVRTDTDISASTALAMAGGGLPTLSVDIERLRVEDTGLVVEARDLQLEDWAAGGRRLGAALDTLGVRTIRGEATDSLRVALSGSLHMSGQFAALALAPTSIAGTITAANTDGAWRVQSEAGRCLDVDSEGMQIGAMRIGDYGTTFCPPGGRIAQLDRGVPGGSLTFDTLALPYGLGAGNGTIGFERGKLDWRLDDGIAMVIAADRLTQTYRSEGQTFDVTALGGDVSVASSAVGPVVNATLGPMSVEGSRLPLQLSVGGTDLTLARRGDQLVGEGMLDGVRIASPGDDPVFQTLESEQAITLAGKTLTLAGPLRLAETGLAIAESTLALSLPGLTGRGMITTPDLVFAPDGLQPADLSDRLRGLLTDATGTAQATTEIVVDRGSPSVSAMIDLDGLDFQTVALGRVRGVNGEIRFDDVLALTTPPGQTVRIAEIDPGVRLQSGEVSFQLEGPQQLTIERARWPFADGAIGVAPGPWRIGGLDNRLEIEADRLELSALTEMFNLSSLQATGTLSGRFPLTFSGSEANISDAILTAAEPGGTLRYTGALGQRAGETNETAKLAFEALENFEFELLELAADGNLTGDLDIRIRLTGRNRDVLFGTPFAFNLAVEAPIVPLIRSGASLEGTGWLEDAIVQQQQGER